KDLADYRVIWDEPLSTGFAGAVVRGPGTPAGCSVLLALNLLQAQRVAVRAPYWRDAAAFAAYARSTRFAIVASGSPAMDAFERAQGLASDCAGRLQPGYAAAMAPRLQTILEAAFGGQAGHHSASVVVVDRWGNVAALVHSINATMWGDTGIVVDGVPLSGAGGLYKTRLAGLKPGQHLPNDMAPVIALRDGKPVLAAASVGSSLVGETVRMTAGLLGDGDPKAVAAGPPLLLPFIAAENRAEPIPAGAYPAELRAAIEAKGIVLREEPAARVAAIRGTAAVGMTGPDGRRRTVEVPQTVVFGDAR
ncbi:MAG TPA: gamma-glutamyltransferase, partial [Phenylobacterium sp.]